MANILKTEKKIQVITALTEGNSIRSIERMTGIHRDTVMRLGVKVGQKCEQIMDHSMQDLPCQRLQLDEIWGFVGKKQRNTSGAEDAQGYGDAWTYVALDADTKLVPCYQIGKRNLESTNAFVANLASRLKNRVQISTDGMAMYADAIEAAFGSEVDYGKIVKTYGSTNLQAGRYSPAPLVKVEKEKVQGSPNMDKVSTSFVERQNLTFRMHCRRMTRLTNAFSKKLENFKAAVGLHFGYYNFVKIHRTLNVTPAMAAGVTKKLWTVADLVEMAG